MNDYPDGPSLSERSGYAQLGTAFGGDAAAARPRNTNPDCNRELRALHAELTLALDEADEELDKQEAEIDNPPKYDPQNSADALADGWN